MTEKKYLIIEWLIVIMIFVIILCSSYGGAVESPLSPKGFLSKTALSLPSPKEIQEELVRRGYRIKVDGKIETETLTAWEKELCNDYAKKAMEKIK